MPLKSATKITIPIPRTRQSWLGEYVLKARALLVTLVSPLLTHNNRAEFRADAPSSRKLLNIEYCKQEQAFWCWAACMEMVTQYVFTGSDLKQCELASQAFNQTTCCVDGANKECNKPLGLNSITDMLIRRGLRAIRHDGPLTYQEIVTEISSERPVKVGLVFSTLFGHAILLHGFDSTNAAEPLVFFHNPDPTYGTGSATYSSLVDGFGAGTWRVTWTRLEKNA